MALDPKALLSKNRTLLAAAAQSKGELELKFAMAVDNDPKKTVLVIEKLGQPLKLGTQLKKDHPHAKAVTWGTLTVVDDDSGTAVVITPEKKISQATRKMSEALKVAGLQKFKNVRLPNGADDEDENDAQGQGAVPPPPPVAARGAGAAAGDDDAASDDDTPAAPPAPKAPAPAAAVKAGGNPMGPPTTQHIARANTMLKSILAAVTALEKHFEDPKKAMRTEYAGEGPQFLAALDKALSQTQPYVEHLHKVHKALELAVRAKTQRDHDQCNKAIDMLCKKGRSMEADKPIAMWDSQPFGPKTAVKPIWAATHSSIEKYLQQA